MSKAYLQFSERYPEAANGYSRVLLGDGTTLADVFDPITGVTIANPVPINADGFVGAYHVENGTVYNIKIYGFLGNLVFERESVTVPGDATGTPGTNGKSVRVQAVTGGAQVYDEFGNTVTVLDGEDGEDGTTPVKGVDYFDGINGTTPVKGVDYVDGADGIAGYIQLPALPVDPSTVPIGQPVILPDGTMWTNVTGSWTALAVSEAMLDAALAELAPVDAITDGSTKAVTSNAVFDALANTSKRFSHYNGNETTQGYWLKICDWVPSADVTYIFGITLSHSGPDLPYGVASYTAVLEYRNGTWKINSRLLSGSYPSGGAGLDYGVDGGHAQIWLYNYGSYIRFEGLIDSDSNGLYNSATWQDGGVDPASMSRHTITFGQASTADTAPAGDNSQAIATTAFVGKPSGSVIALSSSQTITPANGAVYYVSGSYDITLSNSSELGTRCYIQNRLNCPQNSKILFTDVAGNSNGVGFGYGDPGAGGVMCERFADGWMVVGGVAQ